MSRDNNKNKQYYKKESGKKSSSISNLAYAFQSQDYYGIDERTVKEDKERILKYKLGGNIKDFIKDRDKEFEKFNKNSSDFNMFSFTAKVQYPGLVVGMANPTMNSIKEGSSQKNEEFKTGFTFDYVSGLPYIPGSSIKGILRESIKKYKEDVSKYLDIEENIDLSISNLIDMLFGDDQGSNECSNAEAFKRDVFFDAMIIDGDKNKYILKEDFITPHFEFENPKPIRILALKSEVKIKFYFMMKRDEIGGVACHKRFDLYKGLLLDLGVGAKTNTGYGKLVEE
jgi:CRISPR-associated RAMP protein, cmr6 family